MLQRKFEITVGRLGSKKSGLESGASEWSNLRGLKGLSSEEAPRTRLSERSTTPQVTANAMASKEGDSEALALEYAKEARRATQTASYLEHGTRVDCGPRNEGEKIDVDEQDWEELFQRSTRNTVQSFTQATRRQKRNRKGTGTKKLRKEKAKARVTECW